MPLSSSIECSAVSEDRAGDTALFSRLGELAPAQGRNHVDAWPGLTIHRFCTPGRLPRIEFSSLSVVFVVEADGAVAHVAPAEDSRVEVQITGASMCRPVFHCTLRIDPQLVRSISSGMYPLSVAGHQDPGDGPSVFPVDDELMHAVVGFLSSLSSGCDRRVLAPLRMSEIVYRLLQRGQRTRLMRLANDEFLRNPIAEALNHIAEHLAEPVSVNELAARAHMSPSAFSRAFRDATGQPPYQYIKDCRLDRAREFLADRKLSVSAVAGAVGYCSVSHFIKEFQRKYGSTPGEYAELSAQRYRTPNPVASVIVK